MASPIDFEMAAAAEAALKKRGRRVPVENIKAAPNPLKIRGMVGGVPVENIKAVPIHKAKPIPIKIFKLGLGQKLKAVGEKLSQDLSAKGRVARNAAGQNPWQAYRSSLPGAYSGIKGVARGIRDVFRGGKSLVESIPVVGPVLAASAPAARAVFTAANATPLGVGLGAIATGLMGRYRSGGLDPLGRFGPALFEGVYEQDMRDWEKGAAGRDAKAMSHDRSLKSLSGARQTLYKEVLHGNPQLGKVGLRDQLNAQFAPTMAKLSSPLEKQVFQYEVDTYAQKVALLSVSNTAGLSDEEAAKIEQDLNSHMQRLRDYEENPGNLPLRISRWDHSWKSPARLAELGINTVFPVGAAVHDAAKGVVEGVKKGIAGTPFYSDDVGVSQYSPFTRAVQRQWESRFSPEPVTIPDVEGRLNRAPYNPAEESAENAKLFDKPLSSVTNSAIRWR